MIFHTYIPTPTDRQIEKKIVCLHHMQVVVGQVGRMEYHE